MRLVATVVLVVFGSEPKVSCRATDEGGALMAAATGVDLLGCRTRVKEELQKGFCTAGVRQVSYWFEGDGARRAAAVLYCPGHFLQ